MRLATRFAALFIITALSALAACGGQGYRPQSDPLAAAWPGHSWDGGARSGAFVAVAVDGTERNVVDLTQRLRVETTRQGGDTLVTLYGSDVPGSSAYLHLKYDGASVHPVEAQRGEGLDEGVLFLGITSQPGVVDLGLTTTGGVPMPGGELQLAQVRFSPGAFSDTVALDRGTSLASKSAPDDLHFNGNALEWTYNAAGDFDQNSEVNIADLTPIGVRLNHSTSDGFQDAADEVVDGDHNGLITIAELTVIGANFLRRVTEYRIESAPTDAGPFTAVTSVPQSSGVPPVGGGFLQYRHSFSPQNLAYYVVRPMDGTDQGPISNMVQYGVAAGAPPQNVSATDDGSKITVTWQPPASGSPTGYDVYVSDDSGMAGAVKLNTTPLTVLTYDCSPISVPVGASHYFAVKALYGATPSAYSNIFHYGIGGTVNPPSGLQAAKVGSQIQLDWIAVGGVDGYNAYVSDNAAMTGALQVNLGLISGVTYTCPVAVDPAVEHYFAVTAVLGTDESSYSNIVHYTPGAGPDLNPPQWQGGTGIRSVEPDNGFVKVYWYPAIDQTPPVQYLIYFAPEEQGIDWQNPSDVVDASQSSYTVPGLTNGQRYEFAVRAQDSVTPTPNVTSNTNTLFATPMVFPPTGIINSLIASDTASVRMPGEEIPRVFSVSHTGDLQYSHWDGSTWVSLDLNAVLINDPARKYHPQALAIGDQIHVLFASATTVYEVFGPKDADPGTWSIRVLGSGYGSVFGTGFAYDANNGYLAAIWGADSAGTDQLFYSDRDQDDTALWNPPQSIYSTSGGDQIWQCDFVINPYDGSQWAVATVGTSDSSADNLKFYYGHRDTRLDPLTISASGKRSDISVIDIDPTTSQPVVVSAEVHDVSTDGGPQPVSDAAVYLWNGSTWITPPGSPIEYGDASFDNQSLIADVTLTGQDPQLVFSPSGKAVAIWSNLHMSVDYSNFPDITIDLDGSWRLSTKQGTGFGPAQSIRNGIPSSNSVTAGEGYEHCVTCLCGTAPSYTDSGSDTEILAKYATRNDYPEGDLYYFRTAWQ